MYKVDELAYAVRKGRRGEGGGFDVLPVRTVRSHSSSFSQM